MNRPQGPTEPKKTIDLTTPGGRQMVGWHAELDARGWLNSHPDAIDVSLSRANTDALAGFRRRQPTHRGVPGITPYTTDDERAWNLYRHAFIDCIIAELPERNRRLGRGASR